MTSLYVDKLLLRISAKCGLKSSIALSVVKLCRCSHVTICLSVCYQSLINIQPFSAITSTKYKHSSLFLLYIWKHCCRFDSQTELMTHFDVETHWQCSFGGKEGWKRAEKGRLGSTLTPPLRVECPRGGCRGAVIQ